MLIQNLSNLEAFNAGMDIGMGLLALVLFLCLMLGQIRERVNKRKNRLLIIACFLMTIANFTDIGTWVLLHDVSRWNLFLACLMMDYLAMSGVMVTVHMYFVEYIKQYVRIPRLIEFFPMGFSFIVCILWETSLITGLFFTAAPGQYMHGTYYLYSQFLPAIVLLLDFTILLWNMRFLPALDLIAWVCYLVFAILGLYTEYMLNIPAIYVASTVVLLILYLQIALQKDIMLAEQNMMLSRQEREIAEERTKLTLGQIQPHFLYNVLSSIMSIEGNPPKTKKALRDFSKYLRENMQTMDMNGTIPLKQEIDHVNHYAQLQMLRFEEIKVDFDIQVTDFEVPPLSVQVLVENAIKHGLTPKENGGQVWVKSFVRDDYYVITVEDDGIGFEPNQVEDTEIYTHIGLKNTEKRIKHLTGGELRISSKPGHGTRAIIRIKRQ